MLAAQALREVCEQLRVECRIVRQGRLAQRRTELDLRPRREHRELRPREPRGRRLPGLQRLPVGQPEARPGHAERALDRGELEPEVVEVHLAPPPVERQEPTLARVVREHVGAHLVGERRQERVSRLRRQPAARDQRRQADLEVDLVVRQVDAGRVVDRVDVDPPAGERVRDPPALRHAEVPALRDDAHAERARRHADGVVRRIADRAVGLVGRADVRPDAAVPQEVGLEAEHRPHERLAAQRIVGDAEERPHLGRQRDALRGPERDDRAG